MLPKRLRLHHPKDFAHLRQVGQAYHHRLMILSVAPNLHTHNRYGFITSKAIGNAVKRNRVRRQLRAAMRDLHPQLKTGYDIAVVSKYAVVGQPYEHILRIMYDLARRAGLLIEHNETLTATE